MQAETSVAATVTQHTPGPWRWHGGYLVGPGDVLIADDGSAGGEYLPLINTQGANARLIASAPDLFAENADLRSANAALMVSVEELQEVVRSMSVAYPTGRE
jgi:hypothetical protein